MVGYERWRKHDDLPEHMPAQHRPVANAQQVSANSFLLNACGTQYQGAQSLLKLFDTATGKLRPAAWVVGESLRVLPFLDVLQPRQRRCKDLPRNCIRMVEQHILPDLECREQIGKGLRRKLADIANGPRAEPAPARGLGWPSEGVG